MAAALAMLRHSMTAVLAMMMMTILNVLKRASTLPSSPILQRLGQIQSLLPFVLPVLLSIAHPLLPPLPPLSIAEAQHESPLIIAPLVLIVQS